MFFLKEKAWCIVPLLLFVWHNRWHVSDNDDNKPGTLCIVFLISVCHFPYRCFWKDKLFHIFRMKYKYLTSGTTLETLKTS